MKNLKPLLNDILNNPETYTLTFKGSRSTNIGVDIISYSVYKHMAILVKHGIPFSTYYPPSGKFVLLSVLNEYV